ncbi:MFS transporter [Galactobacter caseinivorans]|uniref:MFS transporter n=1 Tax=Galactobacter caseinivorans TaxID=2676123 RepID=A0A496PJV3_9MICC|nr:MFS transporter [Galactobacter caseinivorans]RKW70775.1 MFS transporter [Galactobacter caseinivorans]
MSSPSAPAGSRSGVIKLLVPAFILLELFAGLVQGWIIPLLAEIGSHYSIADGALNWILSIGLLSSAVSVPLLTMLADRFGVKPLLVLSAMLTAAGSLMIAFAPSFPFLILGAALQGPVAALLPLEMATLKRHLPHIAGRVTGILVGVLTIGFSLGALMGGWILEWTGNLVFTQAVPAVALVLIAAVLLVVVPVSPGNPGRVVDWAGAGLLSLGLVGLMYGLSNGPSAGWADTSSYLPALVGVAAIVAFIFVEMRAREPLFNLALLRRVKLGIPLAIGLLAAMILFGSQTPMVLFLTSDPAESGYGTGVSSAAIGMIIAITGVGTSLGAFAVPLFRRVLSLRMTVALGAALPAVAMTVVSTGPTNPIFATICFTLAWFGVGILLAAMPGLVVERAPEDSAASISGIYNTGRTLGGSLSGAIIATIMTSISAAAAPGAASTAVSPTPFLAFQVVFLLLAAISAVAVALAFRIREPAQQTEAATAGTKEAQA